VFSYRQIHIPFLYRQTASIDSDLQCCKQSTCYFYITRYCIDFYLGLNNHVRFFIFTATSVTCNVPHSFEKDLRYLPPSPTLPISSRPWPNSPNQDDDNSTIDVFVSTRFRFCNTFMPLPSHVCLSPTWTHKSWQVSNKTLANSDYRPRGLYPVYNFGNSWRAYTGSMRCSWRLNRAGRVEVFSNHQDGRGPTPPLTQLRR
jgi:hypothetical protein